MSEIPSGSTTVLQNNIDLDPLTLLLMISLDQLDPDSDFRSLFQNFCGSEPEVLPCSVLTFERYLCVSLQVRLQSLVIHVLRGGKRGGDRRVNPAEVHPGSCCVSLGSCPRCLLRCSEQRAQTSPCPGALHGGADRVTQGALGQRAAAAAEHS